MHWKLLFVFFLAVALLSDVDAASRDRKKKKNRNDDDAEETTGGSTMEEGGSSKKDDKDGEGRERERGEKEKAEKKSSESSSEEEDEDKKNGTEIEVPKRFLRHVNLESILDGGRVKRNQDDHVKPRKGLAANPDNHFNQQQRAENPLPKSQTHARQGHAANPENHKPQKRSAEFTELPQAAVLTQQGMEKNPEINPETPRALSPANLERVHQGVMNRHMRMRRQVVTENGELYHAENAEVELESTPFPSVAPSSESSEEIIRAKRSHTREHSLAPAKEINDGQQLTHKCSATSTPHKDEHQHHGTKTSPVLAPGTHGGDDHSHDHDEKHCDKEGHDHAHLNPHLRKGLAANPDNHFNQKMAAEHAEEHEHAKAHTHARQGHAAHPDNHKEDHH